MVNYYVAVAIINNNPLWETRLLVKGRKLMSVNPLKKSFPIAMNTTPTIRVIINVTNDLSMVSFSFLPPIRKHAHNGFTILFFSY